MSMTSICRRKAFEAVRANDVPTLARFVKNKIEANWRLDGYPTENTLLELACELGHIDVATWLIDQGADINAYCITCSENLMFITEHGVEQGFAYLGPLTTAIYFAQSEAVALLMERGVNLDLPWERCGREITTCRQVLHAMVGLCRQVEKIQIGNSTRQPNLHHRHGRL